MTYDQLIAHFKSDQRAAVALGTSPQRVYGWRVRKATIPLDMQIKAERASYGAVRADIAKEDRVMLAENARKRVA